mmetsp:Transcript_28573/g.60593  ORF Transcript_28573/g.60593 Transcript_28573/m.60593 type:complete len:669 (+) Transcript_28573:102-2108(+)
MSAGAGEAGEACIDNPTPSCTTTQITNANNISHELQLNIVAYHGTRIIAATDLQTHKTVKMNIRRRSSKRRTLVSTLIVALTMITMSCSMPGLPSSLLMPASAFSFSPVTHRATAITKQTGLAPKGTICDAKLNKIASNFDLDEILSNEKEFDAADASAVSSSKGRRKYRNKDSKKRTLKEQLKKEKIERQKMKKQSFPGTREKADLIGEIDESTSDGKLNIDHELLIQNIAFFAYEIPPHLNNKRIDAVLADLLNKDDDGSDSSSPNHISISRSQCETLISNECVYIVQPEEASGFRSAWRTGQTEAETGEKSMAVPHLLIEQHSSPVQRKSHPLESSSILIYPSRQSLLATSSSSTLLSNFIPTEIIAQKIPFEILYEDEHMIVINKQAGMVVHPAAGNWDGTMVNALAYYLTNESPFGAGEFFADNKKRTEGNTNAASSDPDVNQNDAVTNSISTLRPGIVHRLDKGTTGVLIVAKTSSALATLSEAFAERKVKKQYLAIAIGNPGEDQWINKPIGRHPQHRQKMRVVPDPSSSMASRGQYRITGPKSASMAKQGRPALSHIHTIHYDGKLSVVQVRIATGRTHQIRVHLQDHGTPIYGDDVYGLSDWNKALSSRKGITRPLLHAQRLEIDHPVTGESMVFEAQVADDMIGVIKTIWPAGEKIAL